MTRNLGEILAWKYPDGGFVVQDDGNGPNIKAWTRKDAKPSAAQIEAWATAYAAHQRRLAILRELAELDIQSIRAVRAKQAGNATEQDDARLASIESQAQALRQEMCSINESLA
ncbi:XkdW family protein [Nitratidesulfovibrio sp. 1201_IL3209]|uniref:XkdW family protein n=1 Tax=Nitratidesulfovibrio sp. 1201_IL3209 TaxID=3084053 RepID=UPI002FDAD9E9